MVNHDGYFQLYDDQGRQIADKIDITTVGIEGILHGVAHVWVWRKLSDTIEVLLQERSKTMLTYPGCLDVSAAGHVDYGEAPIGAAVRETEEELGVKPDESQLWLAGVERSNKLASSEPKIIENELQWVYLYQLTGDDVTHIDPDEVSAVRWVSLDDFYSMTKNLKASGLVPHDDDYYQRVIVALRRSGQV